MSSSPAAAAATALRAAAAAASRDRMVALFGELGAIPVVKAASFADARGHEVSVCQSLVSCGCVSVESYH